MASLYVISGSDEGKRFEMPTAVVGLGPPLLLQRIIDDALKPPGDGRELNLLVLAMAVLGAHLGHGLWTAVQDLGVTGRRIRQVCAAFGGMLAMAVMVGNMTIPLAVWTGLVK